MVVGDLCIESIQLVGYFTWLQDEGSLGIHVSSLGSFPLSD